VLYKRNHSIILKKGQIQNIQRKPLLVTTEWQKLHFRRSWKRVQSIYKWQPSH